MSDDAHGGLPPEEPPPTPLGFDVDEALHRITRRYRAWAPANHLQLAPSLRWKPHLIAASPPRVLHVLTSQGMPRYLRRRLLAAAATHQVLIALPFEALYRSDVLCTLAELDAYVHVVDDEDERPRHYLAAMADLGVAVEQPLRTSLAAEAWQRRADGTPQQRGRRLEALLAFLLSQVADFRIFQRNLRNASQEIDIVVQVDNASDRCWWTPGVPFILVEAKNRKEATGAPDVSGLIRKIETKRGRSKLGLMFTTSSFTSDARTEEIRLSQSDMCVAMLGPREISDWIASTNGDAYLESHVAQAMLR